MLRRLIGFFFPGLMGRIEAESRAWQMQCPRCDYETSVWNAGGMRYLGLGTVYRFGRCPGCGKSGMLRVYKRADSAQP
jgi:predicted RNA-binding Zn-ribbon protein involved in translation (DUF1610 family)